MKKYRKIHEVLVWQWTGDTSIVDEINEVLKPYNGQDNGVLKVELQEECLLTTWSLGGGTTREVVRLNEYVVFDLNDEFYPLSGYNKNWLDKKYTIVILSEGFMELLVRILGLVGWIGLILLFLFFSLPVDGFALIYLFLLLFLK